MHAGKYKTVSREFSIFYVVFLFFVFSDSVFRHPLCDESLRKSAIISKNILKLLEVYCLKKYMKAPLMVLNDFFMFYPTRVFEETRLLICLFLVMILKAVC